MAANLLQSDGYLLINDTTWARFGKKLAGTSFVWDSSSGKSGFGMNVVLLIRTDGRWWISLGLRIWKKGGKSKLKLTEEMLCEANRRGITPMYVLFDNWC